MRGFHIAVIGFVLFGSGCANMGRSNDLEAAIARAQATADDALRQAKAANMKADEALQLIQGSADGSAAIMSTRQLAEKALEMAEAAKGEALKTNQRAERMFRKALAK